MGFSFENPVILTTRCRGFNLLDDGIALPFSPRRVYASTPRSSTILWLAESSEPRWVHTCTLEGFTESSPKLSDHDRILRRHGGMRTSNPKNLRTQPGK